MKTGREFQIDFFKQNPNAKSVIGLFDYLPGIYFYAKDKRHRYIVVNQATLKNVFGLDDDEELLGRTDSEFQPPALAEAYHAEDRRVMDGREPIPNQVWLVPHVRGTPQWYVSTKTPLFDNKDQVIGIAGVMYPIKTPQEQARYFHELLPVIKYLDDNYTEAVSMKEMAAIANLSATQFNQRFRQLLRTSPTEYVLTRRIQHAQQLLTETQKSIVEVGADVGFYDQSHFTKRFRRITGLTPVQYRNQFR